MRLVMQFGGPFIGLVAILPAGLYSLAGWGSYLAFWLIMLGATLTVDRLSRTLEAVQRRTAEMAGLERFSRDVIRSTPDIDYFRSCWKSTPHSFSPMVELALCFIQITPCYIILPTGMCPCHRTFAWQARSHRSGAKG
jgi:hypothetical protein